MLLTNLFFSIYRICLYVRCHMYFNKSLNVVTSGLYVASFVPQGDLGMLCGAYTELVIIRVVFHQVVLCSKTSKTNNLGSDS